MARPVNQNSLGDMIQKILGCPHEKLRLSLTNQYLKKGVIPENLLAAVENQEALSYRVNYVFKDEAEVFLKNLMILDLLFKPQMVRKILSGRFSQGEIQKQIQEKKENLETQRTLLSFFAGDQIFELLSLNLQTEDIQKKIHLDFARLQESDDSEELKDRLEEVQYHLARSETPLAGELLLELVKDHAGVVISFEDPGGPEEAEKIERPELAFWLGVYLIQAQKKQDTHPGYEKDRRTREPLFEAAFFYLLRALKLWKGQEPKNLSRHFSAVFLNLLYRMLQPFSLFSDYQTRSVGFEAHRLTRLREGFLSRISHENHRRIIENWLQKEIQFFLSELPEENLKGGSFQNSGYARTLFRLKELFSLSEAARHFHLNREAEDLQRVFHETLSLLPPYWALMLLYNPQEKDFQHTALKLFRRQNQREQRLYFFKTLQTRFKEEQRALKKTSPRLARRMGMDSGAFAWLILKEEGFSLCHEKSLKSLLFIAADIYAMPPAA